MARGGDRHTRLIVACLACALMMPALAAAQDASDSMPPLSTTEVPPVIVPPSQNAEAPGSVPFEGANPATPGGQIQVPPAELRQELQSMRDFMADGDSTSSLGMVLHEDHRAVDGSGEAAGLLVVDVMPGTPAAQAGLRGLRAGISNTISGLAFVASMFFPPATMAAAAVTSARIGESYDLIIGVDGQRVTNFIEFSDRMRFARPGELVYLSISRNGRRIQVPVTVPYGAGLGAP